MLTRVSGDLMVVNFVMLTCSFSFEFYHLIETRVLEKTDLLHTSKMSFAPHAVVERKSNTI